jgi:hypothetical protein
LHPRDEDVHAKANEAESLPTTQAVGVTGFKAVEIVVNHVVTVVIQGGLRGVKFCVDGRLGAWAEGIERWSHERQQNRLKVRDTAPSLAVGDLVASGLVEVVETFLNLLPVPEDDEEFALGAVLEPGYALSSYFPISSFPCGPSRLP